MNVRTNCASWADWVARYPALARYAAEVPVGGAQQACHGLMGQSAYCDCDESCHAKRRDVLRFDALTENGELAENFVAWGECVASGLSRLPSPPLLIIRTRVEGFPQGPHWPIDGYVEVCTREAYLWPHTRWSPCAGSGTRGPHDPLNR